MLVPVMLRFCFSTAKDDEAAWPEQMVFEIFCSPSRPLCDYLDAPTHTFRRHRASLMGIICREGGGGKYADLRRTVASAPLPALLVVFRLMCSMSSSLFTACPARTEGKNPPMAWSSWSNIKDEGSELLLNSAKHQTKDSYHTYVRTYVPAPPPVCLNLGFQTKR